MNVLSPSVTLKTAEHVPNIELFSIIVISKLLNNIGVLQLKIEVSLDKRFNLSKGCYDMH
jgi:hypothetical protein